MLAYRESRILSAPPALLAGPRGLKDAVARGAPTAGVLERIFVLGTDVFTVEFKTLAGEPGRVLDALARPCRTGLFGRIDTVPIDRVDRASFAPLATAAKLAVGAPRAAGPTGHCRPRRTIRA